MRLQGAAKVTMRLAGPSDGPKVPAIAFSYEVRLQHLLIRIELLNEQAEVYLGRSLPRHSPAAPA